MKADEESSSRQALARKLGVSTHTIQRILVDGDVPRLREIKNTRIRRAWARILTRLALGMDRTPREWIEMAGIPFDTDTARRCKVEVMKVMARRGDPVLAPGGMIRPGRIAAEVLTAAPGYAWPAQVSIGLAARGALSANLEGLGGSFLEVFMRRLVGAVNPSTRLGTENMEEHEAVIGLRTAGASLDIGVGITETVHRRYLGFHFVSIPGISMRLGAICLKDPDRAGSVPDWRNATLPGRMKDRYFLVVAGDVAHDYLAGQCGIAPEEILLTSDARPDKIAGALLEETENHPD